MTEQALDDLIRRVMLDAGRQEYGTVLDNPPEHDFSPAFEKKMGRLIRRANHPVRYRVIQTAACFLLAALLSGCTVLAVSPEIRQVFVNWVREFQIPAEYPPYYRYTYSGEETTLPDGVAYRPTWVPEGYKVYDESSFPGHTNIYFENDEGKHIDFLCLIGPTMGSFNVTMDEGDIKKQAEVNGLPADLYIDKDPGDLSGIVWASEDGGFLFVVLGGLPEESLIRMAESVCLTLPRQAPHRPSWHPEEFVHEGCISGNGLDIFFRAEDGREIHSYFVKTAWAEERLTEIQETVAGLTPRNVQVCGDAAELYEGKDGTNHLVWPAEDGLYWIYGPVDGEILLRVAESMGVQPAELLGE